MKKRIAVFLLTALLLCTCGSRIGEAPSAVDPEPEQLHPSEEIRPETQEAEYAGTYRQTWTEEIAGTVLELNAYIVLQEDGTGYWIAQDVGTLTWDKNQVMLTVGESYEIAMTQENGTVSLLVYRFLDENGECNPTVFERIQELPVEIASMIADRR